MTAKAKSQFSGFLKGQGLKWTRSRQEVLEQALALEGHFEAEELAFHLREKGSRVSKATVYRTLPLLVRSGFLKEAIHGEKHQHYEHVHRAGRHDHLVCVKCGRIEEFEDGGLRKIEEKVCREHRFFPQKVVVEIFGTCAKCR